MRLLLLGSIIRWWGLFALCGCWWLPRVGGAISSGSRTSKPPLPVVAMVKDRFVNVLVRPSGTVYDVQNVDGIGAMSTSSSWSADRWSAGVRNHLSSLDYDIACWTSYVDATISTIQEFTTNPKNKKSAASSSTSATSIVRCSGSDLIIIHQFRKSLSSSQMIEANITLLNNGTKTFPIVQYRRMTSFNDVSNDGDYVTTKGGYDDPTISSSSHLVASYITNGYFCNANISVVCANNTPTMNETGFYAASYEFQWRHLMAGRSVSFMAYYGVSAGEYTAFQEMCHNGIEMGSLWKPASSYLGYPETWYIGYSHVGGNPLTFCPPPSPMPSNQPTTSHPSSLPPITDMPSSLPPTTDVPTTASPSWLSTTLAPSTMYPSTLMPSTTTPSTAMPTVNTTTLMPTVTTNLPTLMSTTTNPSTLMPTTTNPSTTILITTMPTTTRTMIISTVTPEEEVEPVTTTITTTGPTMESMSPSESPSIMTMTTVPPVTVDDDSLSNLMHLMDHSKTVADNKDVPATTPMITIIIKKLIIKFTTGGSSTNNASTIPKFSISTASHNKGDIKQASFLDGMMNPDHYDNDDNIGISISGILFLTIVLTSLYYVTYQRRWDHHHRHHRRNQYDILPDCALDQTP